jgi:hypothetical protein
MKKNATRADQQLNENLTERKVDAPESRFQTEQQINPAVNAGSNQSPDDSFVSKKNSGTGAVLRQEVASEVITSKNAKAAPGAISSPASYGLRAPSFSGDTGTILGSASGTPILEKDFQGKSRFDKRISDANKDLNFNASEQVYSEFKQIPALADSDSTVGYNGNPKNSAARSQKNVGLTPAEELYDRSLDFIGQAIGVFTSGQRVNQEDVVTKDYPSKTYFTVGEKAGLTDSFSVGKEPKSGNFMPTALKVQVTRDNRGTYVSSFEVIERDLSANEERFDTVNASATNAMIDRNASELTRQRIDAVAGSPSQKGFNPLGRSVEESSAYVHYLRDIEASTGATVFAAYKFAQKARGHYLNRTAKDGQDLVGPAIDALYGGLTNATSLRELQNLLGSPDREDAPYFFKSANGKGSAAVMINAFDSVSKYKTKADLINQPRSLKMHLQTADNNMDPFRCKPEFVAALNSVDAYSSIDHEYDPMAPVYITDDVKLIYPYSWRRALQFTRDENRVKTYQSEVPCYFYAAGAGVNQYYVVCADPVLNGIAYFLDLHSASIYEAIGDKSNGTHTLYVPIQHSTTHFSLWDYMVCAATPYIIYERTNTMKDILDFEMNFEYPFVEFKAIKDLNPMNAVNYGNPSAQEPLQVKQMLPSSACRWKMPEILYPLGGDRYLLPWYFSERDIQWDDERTADASIAITAAEHFSTPVLRAGMKLAGLEEFFDMDVRDKLYNLDVMTRMPGSWDSMLGGVYKYSQGGDGIPYITVNDAAKSQLTVSEYLRTPRQLGWFCVLPGSITTPARELNGDASLMNWEAPDVTIFQAGTSYYATMYKGGITPVPVDSGILGDGSVNVNRAQAFTQNWMKCYADGYGAKDANFDLLLSPADALISNDPTPGDVTAAAVDGITLFRPFVCGSYSRTSTNIETEVYGGTAIDSIPKLFSIMRIYWAMIQKLPFVINPFATKFTDASDVGTQPNEVAVDPFDLAYLFGLAGFVSANYYEDQYNRANEVLNQGYGYVKDPMVAASPVFKDSYKYTEV